MFIETLYTEGLSINSYLFGCGNEAAIVDPSRDIERVIQRLSAKKLKLKYIFETHIHADFLSGSRQLAEATGATIVGSGIGLNGEAITYGFKGIHAAQDGETFDIGNVRIEAMHTPGHTPEHMSYLLIDRMRSTQPIMFFTGDFLFVGAVGRPDLLGESRSRALANALYDTLYGEKLTALPDHLLVLPGHGSGSACGKSIGEVPSTTLGTERLFNEAFTFKGKREAFIEYILKDQPAAPAYFPVMKKYNAEGPAVLSDTNLSALERLSVAQVAETLTFNGSTKSSAQILDIRQPSAFAGGHIPGSISIWFSNNVATWAGWVMNYEQPIILVADNDAQAANVATQLRLIGYDHLKGVLTGGFEAWQTSGYPIANLNTIDATTLDSKLGNETISVLDVRTPSEVASSKISGSVHVEAGYVPAKLSELDASKHWVITCGGGFRASLAASILKRAGFTHVTNLLGGMSAWNNYQSRKN